MGACESCGAGQYQNLTAQTSCLLATAGRYTANENDEQVDSAAIKLMTAKVVHTPQVQQVLVLMLILAIMLLDQRKVIKFHAPLVDINMVGQTACILVTAGFYAS